MLSDYKGTVLFQRTHVQLPVTHAGWFIAVTPAPGNPGPPSGIHVYILSPDTNMYYIQFKK